MCNSRRSVEQLQPKLPVSGGYGLDIILDEDGLSGTGDSESVFDKIDDYDLDGFSSDFTEEDGILDSARNLMAENGWCINVWNTVDEGKEVLWNRASNLILLLTSNSKSTLA